MEIALPRKPEELMARDLTLLFFQNGLPIPSPIVGRWSGDQGLSRETADQTLRIPRLAPGEYRVCLVPWQVQPPPHHGPDPENRATCDSGILAAGGTLSLKPGS